MEEVVSQAEALVRSGRRSVLLIGGEVPEHTYVDYLEEIVHRVARIDGIRRVMVEFAPLSDEALARIRSAGASTYILFQETYDRATYVRPDIHAPGDPKSDYERRVSAPGQAAHLGFQEVNLGVLFGLADPVLDTLLLVAHARWLEQNWPGTRLRVSIPRFKRAEGARFEQAPVDVPDTLFERCVCALRVALPDADIVLTAREPAVLRNRLFSVATNIGAGGRTSVGSYASAFTPLKEQFLMEDARPFETVREHLLGEGFLLD